MARRKKRQHEDVSANMTPMIDMTFQLIIFFILVGQMANDALARLELHKPFISQAVKAEEVDNPYKVIINVVAHDKTEVEADPLLEHRARCYIIRGKEFDIHDNRGLVEVIKEGLERTPEELKDKFYVELRADKRVRWYDVKPAVAAARDAKIPTLNISAEAELGEVQ
jgi:biopolymer transport protein ExbD